MAFKRKINVIINNIRISDLRIDIEIEKSEDGKSKLANIKIYNLSPLTIKVITNTPKAIVQIDAGHLDMDVFVIFVGRLKNIDTKDSEDNINTITTIIAYDDAEGLDQPTAIALPRGGAVASIINLLCTVAGMPLATPILPADNVRYPAGFSYIGSVKGCLNDVVQNKMNKIWSVQDGKLFITNEGESLITAPIILSPLNGLIGSLSPIVDSDGAKTKQKENKLSKKKWEFTSLLLPRMKIGLPVQITSREFTGGLKIVFLKMKLSNYENDFICQCEGEEV